MLFLGSLDDFTRTNIVRWEDSDLVDLSMELQRCMHFTSDIVLGCLRKLQHHSCLGVQILLVDYDELYLVLASKSLNYRVQDDLIASLKTLHPPFTLCSGTLSLRRVME